MKKRIIAFALLVVFLVTGCANQGGSKEVAEPDSEEASSFTLIDSMGNEVEFTEFAESCVTCYYGSTYTMMALGLKDKLVGIEGKADSRPLYSYSAPELLELDNIGTLKQFDVEATVALEPDVIFLNKRLLEYKETLEAVGIKVLMIDMETHEELEEVMRLMATVCGKPESAENMISYYNEEFEKAAKIVEGAGDKEKPLVYISSPSNFLRTCPEGMYQADLIKKAGGVNAAGDLEGSGWVDISYEHILAMDPDVIILPVEAEYTVDDVLNDPELSGMKAIQNGEVYHMPVGLDAWDSAGPSGILGLKYILSTLYPELYTMDEMWADAEYFYETYFGFKIDGVFQ